MITLRRLEAVCPECGWHCRHKHCYDWAQKHFNCLGCGFRNIIDFYGEKVGFLSYKFEWRSSWQIKPAIFNWRRLRWEVVQND